MTERPVTEIIRMRWRHEVIHFQTELGVKDWGEQMPVKNWIAAHGLHFSGRDQYLDPEKEGALQIAPPYPAIEDPTSSTKLGIFAVIGDDEQSLLTEAIAHIAQIT